MFSAGIKWSLFDLVPTARHQTKLMPLFVWLLKRRRVGGLCQDCCSISTNVTIHQSVFPYSVSPGIDIYRSMFDNYYIYLYVLKSIASFLRI